MLFTYHLKVTTKVTNHKMTLLMTLNKTLIFSAGRPELYRYIYTSFNVRPCVQKLLELPIAKKHVPASAHTIIIHKLTSIINL